MASSSWWAIGANVQPVAGVGTSYTYFYGTQAAAEARAKTVVDGTVTGPFGTEADAKAAVAKGQTAASPQAAETPSELGSQVSSGIGTLAGFLGVGSVSGTNLVIRGLKVIIGGMHADGRPGPHHRSRRRHRQRREKGSVADMTDTHCRR